jgi:ferredoxin-NADP reductase
MLVKFIEAKHEAAHIKTFYFEPEKPLTYIAGQFVEVTMPVNHSDDRGPRRWFTLSSSPTEKYLSITTKFATDQSSSFKTELSHLEPDDELNFSEPIGDFVLPKDPSIPLIFIAGGIGITPFHSMIRWLIDDKSAEHRPIKLLYGVRNEDEIIFQDTIDKARLHATVIVDHPSSSWGGEHGPMTADMVLGLTKPTPESLIYLSGPEPMIEGLTNSLYEKGMQKTQLITDFFPGYTKI